MLYRMLYIYSINETHWKLMELGWSASPMEGEGV